MTALREWLASIVLVSVLVSAAQTLVPEGSVRKIAAFTGGLILLLTLLQPLLGVRLEMLDLSLEAYRTEVKTQQSVLEQASEKELEELIEQQTAAYIWDKADALGLEIRVQVCAEGETGSIPVPVSAELWGTYSEALAAYLERELGIPAERQVWHEN